MAITSLVLGISSFFCWIITGLPALILGIVSLVQINRSGGRLKGEGMAIAGIVTGSISTLFVLPIMIALLLPAVQAAREAARRNHSTNNMKQIMLGLLNHHDARRGFPPAGGGQGLSWRVHILPFLEEQELYEQFHLDEPWDSDHNKGLIARMPDVYKNPNDVVADGETTYLAVTGPGTAFEDGKASYQPRDFTDGTSRTIMIVEADADQSVIWTKPDDWQFDPNDPTQGLGSLRPGGFLAAFADAHLEFISNVTDDEVVKAMMTRAGGEQIPAR
jgi:uncharacterized membrane protein